jgi:hypothetical protein
MKSSPLSSTATFALLIVMSLVTISSASRARAALTSGITNITGDVVIATPPTDISNGMWESNTEIRAFAEQQQLALSTSACREHHPAQPIPISVAR